MNRLASTLVYSLFVISASAHAVLSIEATSKAVTSRGNGFDSNTDLSMSPSATVDASVFTFNGTATASTSANGTLSVDAAGGYNSFFGRSQSGSYTITSDAIWTDVLLNGTSTTQNYTFDFLVPKGKISASTWRTSHGLSSTHNHTGDYNSAAYNIDILLDGISIWNSSASVSAAYGSSPGNSFAGNSLGGAITLGSSFFEEEITYSWNSYNDTAIFSLNSGQMANLSYVMHVEVMGLNTPFDDDDPLDDCSDASGSAGGESCFGIANISDPFNTSVITAITSTSTSAVPVPAAFWLFGSGLIGLLSLAKCKRA